MLFAVQCTQSRKSVQSSVMSMADRAVNGESVAIHKGVTVAVNHGTKKTIIGLTRKDLVDLINVSGVDFVDLSCFGYLLGFTCRPVASFCIRIYACYNTSGRDCTTNLSAVYEVTVMHHHI